MPFFAMQYCLNVGRRNKLFHLPVDHVIVKLERLDFLYFFRSSFHALLQLEYKVRLLF